MAVIDPRVTFRKVEERLETETDPVLRRNLETLLTHMKAEMAGDVDGLLAVVHSVLFWAGNVVLSPLILLATFFLDRKRTIHDLLLGTVVVRADR